MNLLSVDWDYFFPYGEDDEMLNLALWDWGHSEQWGGEVLQSLWVSRAMGFLRFGRGLPSTSGDEATFWQRFKFSDDCHLFIADSHKGAVRPEVGIGITEVYNYDAHHDLGYRSNALHAAMRDMRVACEDWMLGYIIGGLSAEQLHVRFPSWRENRMDGQETVPEGAEGVDTKIDDNEPVDVIFDRIFIARSGSWVPPWIDDKWEQFIADCPVQSPIINDDAFDGLGMVRRWDISDAEQLLQMMNDTAAKSGMPTSADVIEYQKKRLNNKE